MDEAIKNGPHASVCTLEMVGFIRGEMQLRVQDIFSTLLLAEEALRFFGNMLKLSRITAVPQAYCWSWLILNLSAQPDRVRTSVNNTMDR